MNDCDIVCFDKDKLVDHEINDGVMVFKLQTKEFFIISSKMIGLYQGLHPSGISGHLGGPGWYAKIFTFSEGEVLCYPELLRKLKKN